MYFFNFAVAAPTSPAVYLTATDVSQSYTVDGFTFNGNKTFLSDHDYIIVINARDRYQVGQMITVQVSILIQFMFYVI